MPRPIPTVFQFIALRLALKIKAINTRTAIPKAPRPKEFAENPWFGVIEEELGLLSISDVPVAKLSIAAGSWAISEKVNKKTNKVIRDLNLMW